MAIDSTKEMAATVAALCFIASCGGSPGESDPYLDRQWYMNGMKGDDSIANINLPPNTGYTGSGVLVAIVDNGIDINHEDLRQNISWGNYSYLPESYGFSNADHGTAVAGIIAAIAGNEIGGRGIAPGAKIVGYNSLRAPSAANIADSLVRGLSRVSISNNSWGDFNSWGEPLHLKPEIEAALDAGTTQGRSGLGMLCTTRQPTLRQPDFALQ